MGNTPPAEPQTGSAQGLRGEAAKNTSTDPQAENRSALKEWASIEQALAIGEISMLLRKGGIWEQKGDFRVEHREFWIFPTSYHQNQEELLPGFRWRVDAARKIDPGPDRVRIGLYAMVEDAYRVEDAAVLRRLEGLHPLAPTTVTSRFAYRNKPYLHVLLLRTFRMPEPYVIPNTLDYEGCISWVELDEPLATHGAVPVIPDREFAAQRAQLRARLGVPGVVTL
jgi:hypothetical protein